MCRRVLPCADPNRSAQHDGEELTPLTEDSLLFDGPRTTYGRVRVLHQIGAGSVGPVFRGEDPATRRPVAIKVLRVGLTPERVAIAATALAAARERLPAHPGLCPVLDSGVHDAEPFVVSAFVDGDSLDVALREYGPANIVDALPRLRLLADALDSAAAVGVTHGGLHLRDIIVSPEHTVLTGIGVASVLERVGVRPPVRRPYAAPEIAQGLGTSAAGDQFALAAIAHEWLSGRRIAGPGAEGFHLPGTSAAGTEAVAAVFCRALDERPEGRYPTVTAFVEALAEIGEALAPRTKASRRRVVPADEAPRLAFDFLEDAPPSAGSPAPAEAVEAVSRREPPVEPMALGLAPDPDPMAAPTAVPVPDLGDRHPLPLDPVAALEADASLADHPMADTIGASPAGGPSPDFDLRFSEAPLAAAADHDDYDDVVPPSPRSDRGRPVIVPTYTAPPLVAAPPEAPTANTAGAADDAVLPSSPAAWAIGLVVAAAVVIGGGVALVRWGTPTVQTPVASTDAAIAPGTSAAAAAPAAPNASVPQPSPAAAAPPPPAAGSAAATPPVATPPAAAREEAPRQTAAPPPPASPPARTRAAAARTAPAPAARPPAKAGPAPPGRLLVRSSPSGAEVFVNGERRGVTPLAVRDLALGGYAVRIARAGYTAAEQRVTLDARRPSRAVEVTLARAAAAAPAATPAAAPTTPGSLVVESRPAGARVILDGRDVGRTPLTLPGVATGAHAVRIELQGYLPITTTTRVEPGARARVAVSLTTERP